MLRAASFSLLLLLPAAGPQETPDRSPAHLALTPDGLWAVTVNSTSNTASLVDLAAGRVTAEAPVGLRPLGVALTRDGRRAVVSNWLSDSVTILDVAPPSLKVATTIEIGDEPRGVAIHDARAFVALGGEAAVAVLDLAAGKVGARIEVGQEPWGLALAPDGRRLVVGNALSQDLVVIDTESLRPLWTTPMRGPNLRHVAVSPDGEWAYLCSVSEKGQTTTRRNIERGGVVASHFSRVPLHAEGARQPMALDTDAVAVGDPDGVAVSPDGLRIAITAGGTREVMLMRLPLPFLESGEPGPFIDPALKADKTRYRRVLLRGRPLGAAFTPDGKSVVISNWLRNELQVVDFETEEIRAIPLGGPKEPSPARRGAAIFYDAKRTYHEWFSCHTCHVDGHTNGSSYDTFNDGKAGNLKKTLSLRGVTKTAPYTWHGWQRDLKQSVHGSFLRTMVAGEQTDPDLDAVLAFLATVDFAPGPQKKSEAATRGEALFLAKNCHACHVPPLFTDKEIYRVGLELPGDAYKGFNPPSLIGVHKRGPLLHDGRAKTIEEVLTRWHRPSKLSDKPDCTPEELADLVAYLRELGP